MTGFQNGFRIIISWKFKNNVWDLRNLIDILKEVTGKDADKDVSKDLFFTGHSVLTPA